MPAVISPDGRILRERYSTTNGFSFMRLFLILLVVSSLYVTNPIHYDEFEDLAFNKVHWYRQMMRKRKHKRRRSNNDSFSQQQQSYPQKDKAYPITDYGIFSLEERYDRVMIQGVLQSIPCKYNNNMFYNDKYNNDINNVDIGFVCIWIKENLCHRKPLLFDRNDRPYTAHRIFCLILLASFIYSLCCSKHSSNSSSVLITTTTHNNKIIYDIIYSVIYRPNNSILSDLIKTNLFIYPALVEMDRIVSYSKNVNTIFFIDLGNNQDFIYMLMAILLIFGIGGFSNLLGSFIAKGVHRNKIQNQYEPTRIVLHGLDSTVAACLAYYSRTAIGGGKKVFFRNFFLNNTNTNSLKALSYGGATGVTIGTVFWTQLFLLVMSSSNGSNHEWLYVLICYVIGGCIGSTFGNYHSQNQFWVFKVMDYFL